MFDVNNVSMTIEPGEGITRITVRPADLYPAIIERIQEVLAGANPNELLASAERGGSARADVLVANARQVGSQAWALAT